MEQQQQQLSLFVSIPQAFFLRLVSFLDLPDQHSLLLTCRSLFHKVVPGLYRSPFRAIIAYDGWRLDHAISSPAPAPPPVVVSAAAVIAAATNSIGSHLRPSTPVQTPHTNNHFIKSAQHSNIVSNNVSNTRANTNGQQQQRLNNMSTSSVSSISTTSTSASSYSLSHRTSSAHLNTALHHGSSSNSSNGSSSGSGSSTSGNGNGKKSHRTAIGTEQRPPMGAQALAQVQNNHRRSASLQQRSYSDHPKGYSGNSSSNGTISGRNITSFSQVNLRLKGNDSLGTSPPSVHVFSRHTKAPTNATMTAISPVVALEQLKLNKITRLLQLFIACTPVQARLPALRYPGYGQQWIRAPCRVDYLQYYIDQQQGNEIMIQCFHLLFADLVHCDENPGLGGNVVPIAPPDQEAYKVLHQIQKEFMGHCADRIRTLSVSVAHTIEHAGTLVPRLGAVTRLELTDLEELLDSQNGGDALEKVLDLIKSHRLTFGYVLKDLILTGKSNSFKLLSSTAPTSPVSLAATGLTTPPTSVPSSPTTPFDPLSSSPFSESYYTSRIPTVTNKNGHSNILTIIEAVKGLERLDLSGWTSAILHLDRIASPQLKALWLSFTFPSSDYMDSRVARLPEYLERCRHLEELRVPIRRADVFGWAANEKRSSLICAPILASSRTKRLPNMRRIHLQGPSVELLDCVIDAAFAFQETLQDLEASSRMAVFQPTTIEWDWYLPRLTRLRLEGPISMHFKLDSLQRCPALEELVLSTMPAEECSDEYQQVDPHYLPQPSRLRHRQHHHQDQPTIADPTSYLMMYIRTPEMYRIGSLRRLKTLKLVGPWQVADTVLRRIADRCTRLRELTLNRTLGLTPGGVLLAIENMHQLERLDLRMDVEDLHLVRVVTRKLPRLNYVRVTNLRQS